MNAAERAYAQDRFEQLFGELSAIGLAADGSTTRLAWTTEAAAAAQWFESTARALGLAPERDRNGNQWAWLGEPGPGAIVTGSHSDSVRAGGRFDGALGVVAGFVAVELLARRGGTRRPLAVVSFADEEGGRFDTPTFGSRLLTGALELASVSGRRDRDGVTLRAALERAGLDVDGMGADPERLEQIAALVELHIEQDTLLGRLDAPLALGTQILPHGRWRFELRGEAGHAGTTPIQERRDPMQALAAAITMARQAAVELGALATVGKLEVSPGATNAIPERVTLWLDVRAEQEAAIEAVLERTTAAAQAAAAANRVELEIRRESFTNAVRFSPRLRERVAAVLAAHGIADVPMATGAGHDAGALADAIATAMLFVRSANGASHSPRELASVEDCLTGIGALTEVLAELANEETGVDGDG